jgi:hypothetical protein
VRRQVVAGPAATAAAGPTTLPANQYKLTPTTSSTSSTPRWSRRWDRDLYVAVTQSTYDG